MITKGTLRGVGNWEIGECGNKAGSAGRGATGHWQWHFANIFAFSRVLLPALSPEINFACTCDCSASRKQYPLPLPSPCPLSPLLPAPRPRTRQSGAAGLVPGTLLRAAASVPGKSTTYAVYIKHKAEHKTQNKHAEQTDKEGPQIKSGRERERGRAAGERQRQTVKRNTISCCCHRQVAGAAVSSDAGETGQGNREHETMTGRGGVQGGEGGLHNWKRLAGSQVGGHFCQDRSSCSAFQSESLTKCNAPLQLGCSENPPGS